MKNEVNKLPFEYQQFRDFLQDAIVGGEYELSYTWKPMKALVEKTYGKKLWNIFYAYCEGYLAQSLLSMEEFYESFKYIPKERIQRVLGAGSNGIVFDLGSNKVLKLYYGERIKITDEPFLRWCLTHESTVFPKVYKMGSNWVVMEKLQVGTKKSDAYVDATWDKLGGRALYYWIGDETKPKDLTPIQNETYEWGVKVARLMRAMNSKFIGWPGDLTHCNVGMRKNGEVVFFDI